MNLRAFHVAFISVSTALAALFGVWALRVDDGAAWTVAAVGSFAVAAGLAGYGAWFVRKTRELGA